jgi:hypothetical protein
MFAFEISVNGEEPYRAGIGEHGSLRCTAAWNYGKESATLWTQVRRAIDEQHSSWPARDLQVGDVAVIRVLDTDKIDPPLVRARATREDAWQARRRYYLMLKKEHEEGCAYTDPELKEIHTAIVTAENPLLEPTFRKRPADIPSDAPCAFCAEPIEPSELDPCELSARTAYGPPGDYEGKRTANFLLFACHFGCLTSRVAVDPARPPS